MMFFPSDGDRELAKELVLLVAMNIHGMGNSLTVVGSQASALQAVEVKEEIQAAAVLSN